MRWDAACRLSTTNCSRRLGKKKVRSCGLAVGLPMSSRMRWLGLFMLEDSMGAL